MIVLGWIEGGTKMSGAGVSIVISSLSSIMGLREWDEMRASMRGESEEGLSERLEPPFSWLKIWCGSLLERLNCSIMLRTGEVQNMGFVIMRNNYKSCFREVASPYMKDGF